MLKLKLNAHFIFNHMVRYLKADTWTVISFLFYLLIKKINLKFPIMSSSVHLVGGACTHNMYMWSKVNVSWYSLFRLHSHEISHGDWSLSTDRSVG